MENNLTPIIGVLEATWSAIRRHNPDVGDAVLCVYRWQRKGDQSRGSYTRKSWNVQDSDEKVDQVHIDSAILGEGAGSVLRTVLHEACHSLARSRGISEVSRQGRYHNRRFAQLAEEVGLLCEKLDGSKAGYVTPGITEEARATYGVQLELLADVLVLYQDWNTNKPKQTKQSSNVKATCPCGRIVRMSKQVMSQGPVVCGVCGEGFSSDGGNDD